MKNIIIKSIESLYKWLKSPEGLFIISSGGYERTFRDKLMFQIQLREENCIVESEKSDGKGKRSDIRITRNKLALQKSYTIIEIKINSLDQVKEITGKSKKEVEKELKSHKVISIKNVNNRLTDDFKRWEGKKISKPVYFIYLIHQITKSNNSKKNRFQMSRKNIKEFFEMLCKKYKTRLIHKKKLSKKILKPIEISLNLYIYAFEMF